MNTGLTQEEPNLKRIQSLADELRAAYEELVAGETIAAPAHIREAVAEWNNEVLPAIDARIIRCHELVRRGLRDEALGHAVESPDLFEAVKLLDLERFGRDTYASWMKASRAAGLNPPSPPQLDKMADLETARDRLTDLRPLLQQWRRMNFERSPLQSRIAMLRDIMRSDTDAESHVWRAMLDTHESHRLMEIKAQLARLREQVKQDVDGNSGQIDNDAHRLVSELEGDWATLKPPDELLDRGRRLIVKARQRRIDVTLTGLMPQLEAADAALATDREKAKDRLQLLLDAWKQAVAERGGIDPADPRLARVGHILAYAELIREHQGLMTEVSLLAAERPATLRPRIAWADELGRMMDRLDDVATRLPALDVDPRRIGEFSRRVADIADEVGRERAFRRILSGVAAAVLLISIAAAAWSVYAINVHRAAVREAVAECDAVMKRIATGEQVAPGLGAAWSAPVRREPQVIAALERVNAAEQKRAGGREAFEKQIADIRTAIAEIQVAPRPDPLAPWPEAFRIAANSLAAVRESGLAIRDEDRAKLEQPAATLRSRAQDFTAAADDAFEDRVRRLEADLAAIALVLPDDPIRAQAKLDDAAAELAKLRAIAATAACPSAAEGYGGRTLVSRSVAEMVAADSQVANVLNGLRARREVVAGLAARELQADRLLMDGEYAAYADAIRKIADDLGSGQIARDYAAAASNHASWQATADWGRLTDSIAPPAMIDAETAKELLDKLRSLGPEVASLHDAKEVTSWLKPTLERIAASSAADLKELQDAFIKILESQHGEMIDGVVWERDILPYPRYYCLLEDRPQPHENTSLKYVIGRPDAQKIWPKTKNTLKFDPAIHEVADSPQKHLAIACKEVVLAPAKSAAVDRLAASVVRACASQLRAAPKSPQIDPCLQAILVRFLVAKACEASPAMKAAMPKSLQFLDAGNEASGRQIMIKGIDNVAFTAALDPERQNEGQAIETYRKKCAAFLTTVAAEAQDASRQIEARELDITRRFEAMRTYRCVGRLRALSAGGWSISGGDPAIRAGKKLYVSGGPQNEFRMVPCVECDAEGCIPAGTQVNGRAGVPVFIEIQSGKKG